MFAYVEKVYRISLDDFRNKDDVYLNKHRVKTAIHNFVNIISQVFAIRSVSFHLDKLIDDLNEKTNLFGMNNYASENAIDLIAKYLNDKVIIKNFSKKYDINIEWYTNKEKSADPYRPDHIYITYKYGIYIISIEIDFFNDRIYMHLKNEIYQRTNEVKNIIKDYDKYINIKQNTFKIPNVIDAILHDKRLFKRIKEIEISSDIKSLDELFNYVYDIFKYYKFNIETFDYYCNYKNI